MTAVKVKKPKPAMDTEAQFERLGNEVADFMGLTIGEDGRYAIKKECKTPVQLGLAITMLYINAKHGA